MTENAISHLVVVDPAEDRPVGVLSTLDVARGLDGESVGINPVFL